MNKYAKSCLVSVLGDNSVHGNLKTTTMLPVVMCWIWQIAITGKLKKVIIINTNIHQWWRVCFNQYCICYQCIQYTKMAAQALVYKNGTEKKILCGILQYIVSSIYLPKRF